MNHSKKHRLGNGWGLGSGGFSVKIVAVFFSHSKTAVPGLYSLNVNQRQNYNKTWLSHLVPCEFTHAFSGLHQSQFLELIETKYIIQCTVYLIRKEVCQTGPSISPQNHKEKILCSKKMLLLIEIFKVTVLMGIRHILQTASHYWG